MAPDGSAAAAPAARVGRPPVADRVDIAAAGLALFARDGFDATTVDAIADAAGISRRSFFRYFASKNDVVWGEFDALLRGMEEWLRATADDVPLLDALRNAVVRFNAVPPAAVAAHRQRMSLILRVPTLQAHSTLRYADWRRVVAEFTARRLGQAPSDHLPQLVGYLTLGAAVATYEQWLADDTADLAELFERSFAVLDLHLPPGK